MVACEGISIIYDTILAQLHLLLRFGLQVEPIHAPLLMMMHQIVSALRLVSKLVICCKDPMLVFIVCTTSFLRCVT